MNAEQKRVHVKVCGVTNVGDAVRCAELDVDAIGLNFVAQSPRCISIDEAKAIVRAVPKSLLVVGVVTNMTISEMASLREATGIGCLQLHGDEPESDVQAMLPHAYKAVRIGNEADVEKARKFPGDYILVDAKVAGALGGTGARFDWNLVTSFARTRRLTLAGGLTPENVAEAVITVQPFCVDTASGVENAGAPRRKDFSRVAAFVRNTRNAALVLRS